eukprot:CAMPEP_0170139918 /NCGR_PEP_ID=MMETSP0033_2-20121228/5997_1 /TAXON_ID=195969 /ORGANISM="Dolichomastix tenuilepis, Strain CCMP3274" /LENGTH=57 /DNA_ID=CAMNT_0010376077 /DNA_START=26 /DNA_END=196 /DNA_ORIENTATION=-
MRTIVALQAYLAKGDNQGGVPVHGEQGKRGASSRGLALVVRSRKAREVIRRRRPSFA